jgi:Tfp pilus assembly protein PilF
MRKDQRLPFITAAVLLAILATMLPSFTASSTSQATAPASQSAREDAYRANNIGVALLEQYKFDEAARSFRRALEIDPKLTVARINLSIALYYMPTLPRLCARQKRLRGRSRIFRIHATSSG